MDHVAVSPAQHLAEAVVRGFDGAGPTLDVAQRRSDMPEENLTTIEEGIRHVQRHKAGDRTPTRVPTSESVGDPDAGSPQAASQTGAAAGALAGTAIAGPVGMVAGAAVGAAVGVAAEGDEDRPSTDDDERKEQRYEDWRRNDERPEERGIRGTRS